MKEININSVNHAELVSGCQPPVPAADGVTKVMEDGKAGNQIQALLERNENPPEVLAGTTLHRPMRT